MNLSEKIYTHKNTIFIIALILSFIGISISYYPYRTEPWETVGGAICGFGFSIALISLSFKRPITKN